MGDTLVLFANSATTEYAIGPGEVLIGRGPDCHIRLPDAMISQRHCRLLRKLGRVWVEDLGSTHGTAINGTVLKRGQPIELAHGDHLWVWTEHFRLASAEKRLDPGTSEDWINSLVAEGSKAVRSLSASRIWDRITRRAVSRGGADAIAVDQEPHAPDFKVTEQDGIAWVHVPPTAVVDDQGVDSLIGRLNVLIASGRVCIIVDLSKSAHLSPRLPGELFRAERRCEVAGGMLKICKPKDEHAAALFKGVEKEVEIHRDVRAAFASAWPKPDRAALGQALFAEQASNQTALISRELLHRRIRLVVAVGQIQGQVVEIQSPQYLVGRDVRCHLRPNDDTVSRLHAMIELRGGRLSVRDLRSTQGTLLNGRMLHGEEAELKNNDELQFGFLKFVVQVEDLGAARGEHAGLARGTFRNDAARASASAVTLQIPRPEGIRVKGAETAGLKSGKDASPVLTSKVVRGAVVVTVQVRSLSEESVICRLRYELQTLQERSELSKMVLDLGNVADISRGAVVMLLARNQELANAGGTLRICNVSAAVTETLARTQLPHLIKIYPGLDAALAAD